MAALRDGHQHWLVLFAVLCAAISAYYYFKIIQAMFFKEVRSTADGEAVLPISYEVTSSFRLLLIFTAVLIVVLGLFPSLVTDWLHY